VLCEAALTKAALEPLGGFDLVIHGAAITTAPDEFGATAIDHAGATPNCWWPASSKR
jgi:hypothetical protein